MSAPRIWICRGLGLSVVFAFAVPGTAVPTQPDFGDPLSRLSSGELAEFTAGRTVFQEEESVADGLGPVFNGTSCGGCHSSPAPGGDSNLVETRFGRIIGGVFDPLASEGGSLLQALGIGSAGSCFFTGETVPADANVVAGRKTTPLFGLGLVDAMPDATYLALAADQKKKAPALAGRANLVPNLSTSQLAVGKFGWKGQVPTLFQFSGDAYLNEMGITNPQFPSELCPQGRCELLACDPVPDLEDSGDDVQAFADFMSRLAAPPRGPVDGHVDNGEDLFTKIGCVFCHQATLTTGRSPVRALDRMSFHPYADFLIHDMGALGDGIVQGQASGREMRTAPLWGLRARTTYLHDGRATTLTDAILAHDGQGRPSRDRFAALRDQDQQDLLSFLRSL